jgi:hypothetical protein
MMVIPSRNGSGIFAPRGCDLPSRHGLSCLEENGLNLVGGAVQILERNL